MSFSAPIARYFPVFDRPYRMRAGLRRLGSDFGNGPADSLYFQIDRQYDHYIARKAEVLATSGRHFVTEDPEHEASLEHARGWLLERLAHEHPGLSLASTATFDDILRRVQEDVAIVRRSSNSDELTMLHVCFPGGWSPSQVMGRNFAEVHGPVPGFPEGAVARSMVNTMVERGPNVRFIWSLCRDAELDHHPETPTAVPDWPLADDIYLRVERQVSHPFARFDSALFLIRTYLYPVRDLSDEQLLTLCQAIEKMPADVAAYKKMTGDRAVITDAVKRVWAPVPP